MIAAMEEVSPDYQL